jgi:hypothetical protein
MLVQIRVLKWEHCTWLSTKISHRICYGSVTILMIHRIIIASGNFLLEQMSNLNREVLLHIFGNGLGHG